MRYLKETIKQVVLCSGILLVGLSSQPWAAPDIILKITGEQWPPYNNYINDVQNPGFMFEIVERVFEKNKFKFEYSERPWARAINETRAGTFDALIGPGKGDAPDFLFPRENIGFTINSFYVRKDSNWKYSGIASLGDVRLGILKAMTYGTLVDLYVQKNHLNNSLIDMITGESYLARNFVKLKKSRIDATIDDLMVIRFFLKQTGQEDHFKSAGNVKPGYGIYLAFSPRYKKAKELAAVIDSGVQELRSSGELARILFKYGAKDWR